MSFWLVHYAYFYSVQGLRNGYNTIISKVLWENLQDFKWKEICDGG